MKTWQLWIIRIISVCSILASAFMLYLFIFHKKECVGWNYELAIDEVGQYGDFVGGVIGTVLSIILLYFTLTLQREDSGNNSKIYQNQQLNDEFFHLLEVYNNILQSVSFNDGDSFYTGKVALHKYVEDLYDGYESTTPISIRRKTSVATYQDFYMRERDFAPVYFRTLYRICEIIDSNEKCDEKKKVEYMKILRAQFTDSELILLRYNAMTPLGQKFAPYINKYNLLKHIPFFLLFEYKEWKQELGNTNAVFRISYLFQALKKEMTDMLKSKKQTYEMNSSRGKYKIIIICNTDKTKIQLSLARKCNIALPEWDNFSPLDSFSHDSLIRLLRYYIKDCFVLHSFNLLNHRKDLELNFIENVTDDVEYIETWVENISQTKTALTL